ncbi:UNVERIFIED_CONTAM: hypothetical protein PYX00_004532 [Menopon gallinae]|uniref:Huntingtin n=1 Tax=Menopon gallinae TaxID=328185 RepID=A0AAW2I611_9NEOP
MVEKLLKALEGLKSIQFTTAIEDTALRKKEKMFSCALIADAMVSFRFTNAQNVPQLVGRVVESLIHLCDDKDSDVRMVADESLNRIIRALTESNMIKVQIELHKEIKKNGPARCLRAALWRFGQLSSYIRPCKGRGHVENLIPCIIEITKREEESVHETLATFIENTFKVVGVFIQDNDIKALLKAFFHNLSSNNAVIRRTAAACINSTVRYCRKPHVFNSYVLNTLLDNIVPVNEENSSYLILGVLGCLRILLPNLGCDQNDEGISGSFGLRHKKDECLLSVDRLIQTYELCLHYSKSKDHNVVTASLETLNQLLQSPPQELESLLLSPSGFSRSYIHSTKENRIRSRSGSEMSVACSLSGGDEALLLDDSDMMSFDLRSSLASSYISDSKHSKHKEKFEDEIKMVDNPFKDKLLGEIFEDQVNTSIDSDAESLAPSEINASSLLMGVGTETIEHQESKEFSRTSSRDDLSSNVDEDPLGDEMNVDVGNFTDEAIPLIYCARHLAASFLLGGTKSCLRSDRSVRVSVKSLALCCISSIVKLYPMVLRINLAKSNSQTHDQGMKDIVLFSDHPDPQIRGHLSVLVASYINSALLESYGSEYFWVYKDDYLCFNNLLDIVFKGLKDESTTCSRQVLNGLKICLKSILFSSDANKILPILYHLPSLSSSPYWLLKVKLVDVLSELPFVCLHHLTSSNFYQDEIITVVFTLLGDEDSRVRTAAAGSLTKIIPRLYHGNSTLLAFSREFTAQIKNSLKSKKDVPANFVHLNPFPPFSYITQSNDFDLSVEGALSRIVARLTNCLLVAVDKSYIFGCLEALRMLSEKYPPTIYPVSWNCLRPRSEDESCLTSNLVAVIFSLLTSPIILDLSALTNAMTVLGNLFAGHCVCNMKSNYQGTLLSPVGEPVKYWNVLRNEQLSVLAERIFTHVMKVLNMYSHLLEEVPLSKATASATAATNLLPISLASPIKKHEKKMEKDDKTEERKQKNISNYKQSPQYAKLYQLLKSAHNNYKVSLDTSVSEKFLGLLESTINVLCILLEIGTIQDTGRCAEEILSYLRPAVSLRPSASVLCVIQLLKSLFGTNSGANWTDQQSGESDSFGCTLFANMYQIPSEFLFNRISNHSITATLECENLAGLRRRAERKIQTADRNSLATYIRLLEPMYIKSVQLYIITNDVVLQSNVLRMLNQLIKLGVNYCLLDADEKFVGFVLKQFELIEHGQIPGVEKLLPEVFKFLVLLSYEKHHSKTIMSIPKILQLCDGLMASNQSTQTHCIPALVPIVEDVFLSRNLVSSTEQKELETQREVVLSMLLRLVEFHEVMNMLTLILNESRTLEERERWKRWSRQIMDTILPLASQDKLRTETFEGQEAFNKLMSSLSPNVLRPVDPLLRTLFVEPNDYSCQLSLKRWLSRVTVIIETILHVKEDVLLCRLEEVSPNINLSSFFPPKKAPPGDPFNVKSTFPKFESSETFARFLLKIISVTGFRILESISSTCHLQRQLSLFFLCVFHILKSGTFHRVSNTLQLLLTKEQDSLSQICSIYFKMLNFAPTLSCQFTYFLALLNYFDQDYWGKMFRESHTLSSKLVQSCSVISLCDYLCEIYSDTDTLRFLLSTNIKEVIYLSNEIPIKELLTTIHRKPESTLLMEAISLNALDDKSPVFVEKLLRILEIAHNSHSGFILSLLINNFIVSPYLALSRLASLLACRRAEFLLTLPPEEVHRYLNRDQFKDLIKIVNNQKLVKRHYTLVGLLNKLSIEVYGLQAIELTHTNCIDTQATKNVQLDEQWYSMQVKERCCQENYSGREVASLLSILNYDQIMEIISCSNFNVEILKDCLNHLDLARKISILDTSNETEEPIIEHPLYKASKTFILKSIHEIVESLKPMKREEGDWDVEHSLDYNELAKNETILAKIWKFSPPLTALMDIIYTQKSEIDKDCVESVMEFALTCLEVINWVSSQKAIKVSATNEETLSVSLGCCFSIVRHRQVSQLMSQTCKRTRLKSCIRNAFSLVKSLIPQSRLGILLDSRTDIHKQYASDELRLMDSLLTIVMKDSFQSLLPPHLGSIIKNFVISLCQIPELSVHILKVPENCDIQDIDALESFISTFSTVNWTSRQQFEEIWVCLLSVLGLNSQSNLSMEDNTLIVQASTAATEGITTLLQKTMINPISKKVLHHGRDSSAMKNTIDKLPLLVNLDSDDAFGDRAYHYLDNLEISKLTDRYHHGLLSVEYIWTVVKQINNRIELYENHTNYVNEIGLDLTSCVHILMELYNQWVFQSAPDIRLVTSCLKSSIVISDLFTDIAQFQWLLDFCLRIEEVVITENVVILPLIIVGCCKAVSIVLPDLEMCDRIKRLLLHSRSIPCKIAAIQGLLYLLQSPVVTSANSHPQRYRLNYEEINEVNFVTIIIDMFLPLAIDLIQQFRQESLPVNEEYERCCWSLTFYLLQHYQPHLREVRDEILNFILVELSKRTCSDSIMMLLVRGVERLLLTSVIDESFKDQILKIALDMTSQVSVIVSRCGLQLLMVLSFLEKRAKDIRLLVTGQEDPEKIMRDMEKINVLFDKLKKSYPEEAAIVGDVISYILMDFTASDVLTKVIQEFLSPQQPHLKILSGLLFKVFERAELSLLEDWVVFSLPSFIQGLPVTMSVWTLNCFFVSASNETWLRSIFPLVQSRLRMAEAEDRRLLCLAASNFYRQLKDEKQKKSFVQTFQNAAKTNSVFSDLLASL